MPGPSWPGTSPDGCPQRTPRSLLSMPCQNSISGCEGTSSRLVALLTDDAIAISDGAGPTETLLRFDTASQIAAVARAGFKPTPAKRRLAGGTPAVHYALVNGAPAILFVVGDQVVGAVTFDVADGRIATVRGIAAPARLARLVEAWRRHTPDAPLITEW